MNKLFYIFSIVLVSVLFSCHQGDKRGDISDSTYLRIALLPTMDNLPLYYAAESGIFDSLDLNVKLLTYSSAMDCDTAFRNGEADGVVSDIIKACVWRASGDSVRVIMSTDLNLYLMTARSARIRSLKSIKEKIIAVTRNSAVDYISDRIMDSAKLERLELNRPQINNITLRCRMTSQNQYDGALLPEPFAADAEAHGAFRLISSSVLSDNLSAVVFHDSTVVCQRENMRKLVLCYNLATDRLNGLLEKGDSSILSYLPDEYGQIADSLLRFDGFRKASLPTENAVRQAAEWAVSRDLTKNQAEYRNVVISTFVKAGE